MVPDELRISGTPRLVRRGPLAPTNKLCPRCLSNLTRVTGFDGWIGLSPANFICEKCGYRGHAHLEPDKEIEEFAKIAREFVYAEELPWEANLGSMGHPPKNDPRALALCLLLKIWLGMSYRDLVLFLSQYTYLCPIIGLKKSPGRMDLQRAMKKLDKAYVARLNSFVIERSRDHWRRHGTPADITTTSAPLWRTTIGS